MRVNVARKPWSNEESGEEVVGQRKDWEKMLIDHQVLREDGGLGSRASIEELTDEEGW